MLSTITGRRHADGPSSSRSLSRCLGPLGAVVLLVVGLAACGPAGLYARSPGPGGTTGAAGEGPTRDGGPGASDAAGSGGILVGPGGGGAPGAGARGGEGGRLTGTGGQGGGGIATGGTGIAGSGMSPGTGGGIAGDHGGGAGGSGARGGTVGAGSGGLGSGGAGSAGTAGGAAGAGPGGGLGGKGSGGVGGGGATGGSASGGSPGPRILSVDFVGGAPGGGSGIAVMDETEIAGARPARLWNVAAGATGSLSSLKVADGTVLAASFSWTSPVGGSAMGTWQVGYADLPGDTRMMNGYLDPGDPGMPATVRVSGLPASFTAGGYDVYVYVTAYLPTGTRTYGYSIGSSAVEVTQVGPPGTTFPGYVLVPSGGGAGNYVVFRRLTASSFTLTATPGTGAQTRAPVNGIQIVALAGS